MPRFTAFRGSELQLRHQSWHLHRALAPEGCVLLQPDSRVYRPGAESLSDGIPRLQYDAESSRRGYKVGSRSAAPLHGDKERQRVIWCSGLSVAPGDLTRQQFAQHVPRWLQYMAHRVGDGIPTPIRESRRTGGPTLPCDKSWQSKALNPCNAAPVHYHGRVKNVRTAGFAADLEGDPSRTYED